MDKLNELLQQFSDVAAHPRRQLDSILQNGQKAVGCMPVYCPEELVVAAGMVPFGVWGEQTEISEAKKYFPAFICSILQTSLEMGLRGDLNGLSVMMIPALCDSLKCMGQNWKAGVPSVPFIPVFHPQNRKTEAGIAFLMNEYKDILAKLEEISGKKVSEQDLNDAIDVCNANRLALQRFSVAAGQQPQHVSATQRSDVIKSARFMPKAQHTAMVLELISELDKLPQQPWNGKKVVTTGILADSPALLAVFEENGIAIVADEVAAESRQYRTLVPAEGGSALEHLARHMAVREGCSVLFDPEKKRGGMILDMVKQTGADGVVVVLTKFCDPEEFDYAVLRKQFAAAGVPHLLLEVDQQSANFEQAKTAVQTFVEML